MGIISLDDAKRQLHVDGADQDALIQDLIDAASRHIEKVTGFVAPKREGEVFLFDRFSRELRLPLRPVDLSSIEIKYLDATGDEQAFEDFRAFIRHGFVRIVPAIGARWPRASAAPGAITVTADVGFEEEDEAIPADMKHDARLRVRAWFDGEDGSALPCIGGLLDGERDRRV